MEPSDFSIDAENPPMAAAENNTSTLILEFKIDGMTCVNCSRTIENAMNKEYGEKGLL